MIFYGNVSRLDIGTTQIAFFVETLGIHCRVTVIQSFCNYFPKSLDVHLTFNVDNNTTITNYSYSTSTSNVTSQLKEKVQANTEYLDGQSSGFTSSIVDKSDDLSFSIRLANIKSKEHFNFSLTYLTLLDEENGFLVVKIPAFPFQKIPFTLAITGTSQLSTSGDLDKSIKIRLPFPTPEISYYEDTDTDEVYCCSTFYAQNRGGEANVVFLLDRSGSMEGVGITEAINALRMFLRQLPNNANFDIISFGSDYVPLFGKLAEYNEDSFKEADAKIQKFEADLGGTNMLDPLQYVLKKYPSNLNIICLTDGCVDPDYNKPLKQTIFELSKINKLHGVALGSNCDDEFIRFIGKCGHGISVVSKNIKNIKTEISKITDKILKGEITNCTIDWETKGLVMPSSLPFFVDHVTTCIQMTKENFALLSTNSQNDSLHVKVEAQTTKNGTYQHVHASEVTFNNTLTYNQIVMSNQTLRERGDLVRDIFGSFLIKETESFASKNEVIKNSLKYGILSIYTSFVAVDKTTKVEACDVKKIVLSQNYEYQDDDEGNQPNKVLNPQYLKQYDGACYEVAPPMYIYVKPTVEEDKICYKELDKSKVFDSIICLQNYSGAFGGVESVVPDIAQINNWSTPLVQTYFVIAFLKMRYSNMKIVWRLLVEKAEKYIASNLVAISDSERKTIIEVVRKIHFGK
ncbi:hypothetical protein EIN_206900 [Entamoeba invadens IP1]|uniref:VWFA domain-containing protein n=1 Tax=Entamoeba invadens IP1 TaxID=370355 RepID=A0A0A1UFI2_ENTIV|nr:hypothetical protein EIN_206900 [Entamoeba invadens IP1]ELP91663.1 hypothetical protein EIN_206900 [Entamoeba invadens IP1]|eukprot:XP_004258434.1 hypothetical protein EIN_206900 [Entamoeba invadens IP1]